MANDPFQAALEALGQANGEIHEMLGAYLSKENAIRVSDWQSRILALQEDIKEFIAERDGLTGDLYHPSNRHLRGR